MAQTRFRKDKKVTITLSMDEYDVLWECLSRCKDCMDWDEESGTANDNENFLWEIDDKKKYETLKNLII